MKKLFVIALAAIGMVACVQNEIVEAPKSDVISFAGAYLDNATRAAADPSFTTDQENPLEKFNVWGFMDETAGTVFNAEDVEKINGVWSYTNTQYWAPEHDYYFAALAPMDSANIQDLSLATDEAAAKLGLGSLKFVNVNGGEDLIYAKAKVTTPGMNSILQNGMAPVQLQFNHLLSKVKFTFKNGFTTNNAFVEVKDIKMTVANNATIDLATAAPVWADLAGEKVLEFGDVAKLAMGNRDECTDERLTIPATDAYTYDIEFTVVVYTGSNASTAVKALEVTKTSTVTGQAFDMGKAYNLVAEITPENLNLLPIEFDVVVNEWEDYVDVEYAPGTIYVQDAAELQAAIDNATEGGKYDTIKVLGDIESDITVTSKKGVKLTIDGQDHSFKGVLLVDGKSGTYTTAGLTVKNFNFDAATISADACIRMGDGTNATRYVCNLTVEGCTFDVPGAVGVKSYTGGDKNLVIKNCVATDKAHSLVQVKGVDTVLVEGCEVYSKNGMNFNNTLNVVIDACEADVKGYAARFGESASTAAKEFVIKNSTLKSAVAESGDAVIILRTGTENATLILENTTLEGTPAILNTANAVINKAVVANSAAELTASLADATVKEITLAAGSWSLPSLANKEGLTIIGAEGAVIGGASASTGFGSNFGKNTTIKNVTFSGTTNGVRWSYAKGGDTTFENCAFAGGSTYGFHIDESYGATFTFNNCEFSGFNAFAGDLVKVVFNSCTFKHNGNYGHTNIWSVAYFNDCTWEANTSVSGGTLYFNGVEESYKHNF